MLGYAAARWKKSVDEVCVEGSDESLVLTLLDRLDTFNGKTVHVGVGTTITWQVFRHS